MRSKLVGHAQQLLGYGLSFLGLGVAGAAFLVAGFFPAVPLWVFVAVGVAVGAPLMVVGGRVNSRGRGRVLGQTPEAAAREHREGTVAMAAFLGFLLALSFVAVLPVFAWAVGLGRPNGAFVAGWYVAWILVFGAARHWVTLPMWRWVERRVLGKREVVTWHADRPRSVAGPKPPAGGESYSSSSASPSTSSLT